MNKPIFLYLGCLRITYYKNAELKVISHRKELTLKSCVKNARKQLEYLPFGELLVEEHLNSYNSPFKFNAKEFDAETGNYYYGARYYSQKYNLMLSVDPMYDLYPSFSPYAYTLQNPVKYIDPTGMTAEKPEDWIWDKNKKEYVWDGNVTDECNIPDGFDYVGPSIKDVAEHHKENNPILSRLGVKPKFGENRTSWPGEILEHETNWVDDWAESSNILAEMSYSLVNEPYITFQALNPFDERVTTLQGYGVNNKEKTEAGANTFSSFIPIAKPANQSLRVLNASQFSQKFQGTFFTRTSHSKRGSYNRIYNRLMRFTNEATLFKSSIETGGNYLNHSRN